jgi:methyl-accepting chemotaxis protein
MVKQQTIMMIEEAIKYINEIGKQERNMVINFANEEKEEGYINSIQDKTEVGIQTINQVEKKATKGVAIAKKTGEVFEGIKEANQEILIHIQGTAQSTKYLVNDTDQVMDSTGDIERMPAELSNPSQEIASMAEALQVLVARFKV